MYQTKEEGKRQPSVMDCRDETIQRIKKFNKKSEEKQIAVNIKINRKIKKIQKLENRHQKKKKTAYTL